jgi:hypothetical protein
MASRGTNEAEVISTVEEGESVPTKFERTGSRRNFTFNSQLRGRFFDSTQIEIFAVRENNAWLVITVFVPYFYPRQDLIYEISTTHDTILHTSIFKHGKLMWSPFRRVMSFLLT